MEVHEHHNIQPDPGPIAHIPANHHAEAVPDQPSCPFCFDAITTENLTTLGGCVCGVQLCITCAHDMRTNGLYNCPLCRRGISHMFNGTTIIPLEVQYFNVVTGVDNFNIEGFSSHSTDQYNIWIPPHNVWAFLRVPLHGQPTKQPQILLPKSKSVRRHTS
jgi:hypothetical protein